MNAIMVYELFDTYLIDDYQNVYRKQTGLMLNTKRSYYLKNGLKFNKYRPEWLLAYVKMNNVEPSLHIVDINPAVKQGMKPVEEKQEPFPALQALFKATVGMPQDDTV